MRAILNMIGNDLRIFFANPGNLIGLVVIPVLLTLVLGWSLRETNEPTTLRVDLLDLDQSAQSASLRNELEQANATLRFCPSAEETDDFCELDEPLTVALGQARAKAGVTSGFVVIPAGYATALASFQPLALEIYTEDDPLQPGPVVQVVESVLQRVNSAAVVARVGSALFADLSTSFALDAESDETAEPLQQTLYRKAQQRLAVRTSVVQTVLAVDEPNASPTPQGFRQSVPGMGSMSVMLTVLGGMVLLLRERRQWTLQRLAVLPLTHGQILAGKIGSYFVLGMLQFLVVFGVGLLVGLDFGRSPVALLALMSAFVLCITALTFALATRITSEGQANGLRNLLGLIFASLGGAWWPLTIVPDFMRTLGHLSPVAWVMDGFQTLLFNGGGFGDIGLELAVLLGAAGLLFVVGARSFRLT